MVTAGCVVALLCQVSGAVPLSPVQAGKSFATEAPFSKLVFSADSQYLMVRSYQPGSLALRVDTGEWLKYLWIQMRFSNDGKYVAGIQQGKLVVVDLRTGREQRASVTDARYPIPSATFAFSPTGHRIAMCNALPWLVPPDRVLFYDPDTSTTRELKLSLATRVPPPPEWLRASAPPFGAITSWTEDGISIEQVEYLGLEDSAEPYPMFQVNPETGLVKHNSDRRRKNPAKSRSDLVDGSRIINTADEYGDLRLARYWRREQIKTVFELTGDKELGKNARYAVAKNANIMMVYAIDDSNTRARIWAINLVDGKKRCILATNNPKPFPGTPMFAAISPNGRRIAYSDMGDRKLIHVIDVPKDVYTTSFARDN